MLGDADLTDRLMACLQAQDEAARLEFSRQPEWAVAVAVFAFCHRAGDRVFIGNLTEEVNRIRAEIGETDMLTPKAVGGIARKSLNASTERVGRGYYLLLSTDHKRRSHQLAHRMGLKKADILQPETVMAGFGGPPCELCEQFGLYALGNSTRLRCIDLPRLRQQRKPLFGQIGNLINHAGHCRVDNPQANDSGTQATRETGERVNVVNVTVTHA